MTDDPRIDPADLRTAKFPGSFRKYDATAVMAFLESVADRVEATNALVDELQRQVDDAKLVRKVAPSEPAASPSPVARALDGPDLSALSDDEIFRLLGEETASVLSTARRASEDIRTKAEANAERLIRESTAEAQRLVEEAEARAATLTAEAAQAHEKAVAAADEVARTIIEEAAEDAETRMAKAAEATMNEQARAAQIRTEADEAAARAKADADALLAQERERADAIRAEAEVDAAAVLEQARVEGRSMVMEAKDVRTRVLADVVRRREIGRNQIERLVEGRDRLLEAYAKIRDDADEMTQELAGALDGPDPDPALEAGFVGIIMSSGHEIDDLTTAPDAEHADDEAVGGVGGTADEGDDGDGGVVTAASEGEADPDSGPEGSAQEPDVESEDLAGAEDDPAAAGDDPAGDDDVDALFARMNAERAESVARAQQVLADDADTDAAADDGVADEVTDAAVAEAADQSGEGGGDSGAVPGTEDSDVDRLPVELLASGDAYAHRAETLDELDKMLSRMLKRHLAHEQNEVLDALRTTESTDVAALLPAEAEHLAGYAEVAIGPLRDAASAAASLIDEEAQIDVAELADALAGNLISPFRRRIEQSASEVDGDADALDERLRALYREWKVDRIGAASTDGLLSAYAEGQLAAAPEDSPVRWLIDPDQGPCPDAQDNALAGAIVAGEAFPTGDACPQAHPGCRCLLAVDG